MLLLMTFSPNIQSQISLETDITANMKVTGLVHRHRHGKIRCGRFQGKTLTPHSLGPIYSDTQVTTQSSSSQAVASGIHYNNKLLRELTMEAEIESTRIRIDLSESRPFDDQGGQDYADFNRRCTHTTYYWNYSEPNLHGKIQVNYKVPENTYLVILNREVASDGFDIKWARQNEEGYAGLKNTLNRNTDPGLVNHKHYMWVFPGSTITQEFSYLPHPEDKTKGQTINFSGSLEYEFIPIPGMEFADPRDSLDKIAGEAILLRQAVIDGKDYRSEALESLIRNIAAFLGNPINIERAIRQIDLADIRSLTAEIRKLRDLNVNDYRFDDIKIAATILNAKIAVQLLSEILPYCESTTIPLPYQNTKVETTWITAANYLLHRSKMRLSYHAIDHFVALLDLIHSFETEGLSFAQVRTDQRKYGQFLMAYDIFRQSTDLRSTPITHSLNELTHLFEGIGRLGALSEKQTQSLELLRELAGMERDFAIGFMRFLRQFQPTNSNPIRTDEMRAQIDFFSESISEVIGELDRGQHIFALTKHGLDFLTQSIIEHSVNDLEIFLSPIDSQFEYFRNLYFTDAKYRTLTNNARQCWRGH